MLSTVIEYPHPSTPANSVSFIPAEIKTKSEKRHMWNLLFQSHVLWEETFSLVSSLSIFYSLSLCFPSHVSEAVKRSTMKLQWRNTETFGVEQSTTGLLGSWTKYNKTSWHLRNHHERDAEFSVFQICLTFKLPLWKAISRNRRRFSQCFSRRQLFSWMMYSTQQGWCPGQRSLKSNTSTFLRPED